MHTQQNSHAILCDVKSPAMNYIHNQESDEEFERQNQTSAFEMQLKMNSHIATKE
nr:hypothetical protein [uncultured Cohaesibacter sp.]